MKTSILSIPLFSAIAFAQVTGKLGDAEVVTNNPSDVTYEAVFPESDSNAIRGQVNATAAEDGTGVVWSLALSSLPDPSLGPFLYHVHDQPVPANGNCTQTLAHLDPYVRGEDPVCDPLQPETCQVGDLSGKFGDIPMGDSYSTTYLDFYTSTRPGPASFIGNRSIVIHATNKTRLACANFQLIDTDQKEDKKDDKEGGDGEDGVEYVYEYVSECGDP